MSGLSMTITVQSVRSHIHRSLHSRARCLSVEALTIIAPRLGTQAQKADATTIRAPAGALADAFGLTKQQADKGIDVPNAGLLSSAQKHPNFLSDSLSMILTHALNRLAAEHA